MGASFLSSNAWGLPAATGATTAVSAWSPTRATPRPAPPNARAASSVPCRGRGFASPATAGAQQARPGTAAAPIVLGAGAAAAIGLADRKHRHCAQRRQRPAASVVSRVDGPPRWDGHCKAHRPLPYHIREVQLTVRIFDGKTVVISKLLVEPGVDASPEAELVLSGEDLKLLRLAVNGAELPEASYQLRSGDLAVPGSVLPCGADGPFWLETEVEIVPEANTQLSGLHFSGGMYRTQMATGGFRRFSFFQDQSGVTARYTSVRIEADRKKCPVLLCNGTQIAAGSLDSGRHFAVWSDPVAKPSTSFALVAGNLVSVTEDYETATGRVVQLRGFSLPAETNKLCHVLKSWKEKLERVQDAFGLEASLDRYNIVAASDLNMNAAISSLTRGMFDTSLMLVRFDAFAEEAVPRHLHTMATLNLVPQLKSALEQASMEVMESQEVESWVVDRLA